MNRTLSIALSFAALATPAGAAATISAGHYQESALKNCSNGPTCVIKFSAIPAGKVLILKNVGCAITSTKTVGAAVVTSRLNNVLTQRSNYPIPTYLGTFGGVLRYNMNATVLDIMNGGEVPEITLSTTALSAEFIPNCSISGELK